MTTNELQASRYSRRCRRDRQIKRRRRLITAAAAAVLCLAFLFGYMSGCAVHKTPAQTAQPVQSVQPSVPVKTASTERHDTDAPEQEKAPEEPPVQTVQEPEQDSTPEPVQYRDDIVSQGRLLSYECQQILMDCCSKYSVPYALGLAMAEVETHFDPDAVSSTGDYGLMQINACNHEWLGELGFDVMTYEGNIEAGIYMIAQDIQQYEDFELALMAYNCGPTGARNLWAQGIYQTEYSQKVMTAYNYWLTVLEG